MRRAAMLGCAIALGLGTAAAAVVGTATAAQAAGFGPQVTLPFAPGFIPGPVAVDAAGNVYVADKSGKQVAELPAGATSSSQWVTLPFTGLSGPTSVAVDAAGDVFVSDSFGDQMVELPALTQTKTATTLSSSASPSVAGQPVTYTATVSPASGTATPTGTVAFTDNGTTIAGCGARAMDSTGKATCPVTYTSPGSHPITATYSGDSNFASSSGSLTQAVNPAANTVTVTSPGNQIGTVGTAASLQIQASDSDSGQTLTYAATGLPAGLSIDSSSGKISGTPA